MLAGKELPLLVFWIGWLSYDAINIVSCALRKPVATRQRVCRAAKRKPSWSVWASPSNENKMSDGGRERALLGVKAWKSSQNVDAERSAVRSIAWLGVWR
jgi:hypothetical protein